MVKNFFQYENVRAVLSSDMKKVLSKLLSMKSRNSILVRRNLQRDRLSSKEMPMVKRRERSVIGEEEGVGRRQGLLERWRNAVRMIIRNKKQEKIMDIVEKTKLDFLFVLNKPQFNVYY